MPSPYDRFSNRLTGQQDDRTTDHVKRTPVAKDRDRITHCGALRRLQRKSQIVGVQSNDFFRTRLTHTYECAQIGRSIAVRSSKSAGLDAVVEHADHLPDLIEAACLAHDLGHPPFGHNGEKALQEAMKRYSQSLFEGNAQSFRIVTHLEPRRQEAGRSYGLDLTRATLKAIMKYPWDEDHLPDPGKVKFCVYVEPDDQEVFEWLYEGAEPSRTLATEILEASDDIAYAAHDFEDGVWSGMLPLFRLFDDGTQRERLLRRAVSRKPDLFTEDSAASTLDLLLSPIKDSGWATSPFDRSRLSRGALKQYTATLIGDFVDGVTIDDAFTSPAESLQRRLELMKTMATVWMIEAPELATVRYGQRRLVEALFDGYWAEPSMLPNRESWDLVKEIGPTNDDYKRSAAGDGTGGAGGHDVWRAKARIICDHIAGMTDLYALHVHSEMFGGGGAPNLRLV